jgi:glyoxylase-like metal-dependent hydrolase (beta-lactamase superfamily II)
MNDHSPAVDHNIRVFRSSGGADIFQIPMPEFPGLWGYAYLVIFVDPGLGELVVLIDAGSGFGESNQYLQNGFDAVSQQLGRDISLRDLTHILITHGHIDHFGGLNFVRQHSQAQLGIHELDRRILTNYTERLSVVAHRLSEYLVEAGVGKERCQRLLDMYLVTKSLFKPVCVDFTYQSIGMRLGPFEMLHVPGHCAGHVVIRLHDILFSGDHVLEETSPHQAPEQLTLSTGLDHYLNSLELLRSWAPSIHLTLGGHKQPIFNLEKRIDAIHDLHRTRLQDVLNILAAPHSIADVSKILFTDVHGYNVLLALEEAGAHVEYLYQRGLLEITNLEELEKSQGPVPLKYRCVECTLT